MEGGASETTWRQSENRRQLAPVSVSVPVWWACLCPQWTVHKTHTRTYRFLGFSCFPLDNTARPVEKILTQCELDFVLGDICQIRPICQLKQHCWVCVRRAELTGVWSQSFQDCQLKAKEKKNSFCTRLTAHHLNPISSNLKSPLVACGVKLEALMWKFKGLVWWDGDNRRIGVSPWCISALCDVRFPPAFSDQMVQLLPAFSLTVIPSVTTASYILSLVFSSPLVGKIMQQHRQPQNKTLFHLQDH